MAFYFVYKVDAAEDGLIRAQVTNCFVQNHPSVWLSLSGHDSTNGQEGTGAIGSIWLLRLQSDITQRSDKLPVADNKKTSAGKLQNIK